MKVLEIDIETAPSIAYIWSLFDTHIPLDRLVKPGYTLSFAARWQGEREIMFYSRWTHGHREMIRAAWKLLDSADAVVHYNGRKFDIPTLNREFVLAGLVPPSNYKQIDLYETVKRQFKFASNKLDHIAEQLGLGNKTKHKGMGLWTGVLAGIERDQRKMEVYNKQDVRLLGRLYTRLQPWIIQHPNRGLYVENPESPVCRICGSTHVVKKGVERLATQSYQRYKCMECGANLRGRQQIAKTNACVLV